MNRIPESGFKMGDSQSETQDSELLDQTTGVASDGDEEEGEALSLKATRFLRLCWLRRRMVYGILAFGILFSLLLALLAPTRYTSTTTLLPAESASSSSRLMNLLASSGSAAGLGCAALGLSIPGDLYIGILGSRNVLDSLITQFDLVHYYDVRLMTDARKSLAADTKIDQDRKSGLITIAVTAKNPVLAANSAQAYVGELNRVVN